MALILLDGKEVEAPKDKLLITVAAEQGIDIPHYCYHPEMKIVASCRMCLVEWVGAPKLMPSCSTRVVESPPNRKVDGKYDMVINTNSPVVEEARASILEFLLLNHPLDCPICDKAGECKLQDYNFDYGNDASRFIEAKRTPEKKDLGETIFLYTSRCIMCTRCVRFTEEISGTEELKVNMRGHHEEISVMQDRPLNNKMMGNVVDLCPVGCLIDKSHKFEARVWNFKHTDSICPGCNVGCNTVLDSMKDTELDLEEKLHRVYRVRPRSNPEVNRDWICDDGRYLLHSFENRKRVLVPMIRTESGLQEASWDEARELLRTRLGEAGSEISVVGSPHHSNEENYLLRKLAEAAGSKKISLSKPVYGEREEFKKFVIEAEKAPNLAGASAALAVKEASEKVEGAAKLVYVMGGDNLKVAKKEGSFLIVQASYDNELTAQADMVLPGAMFTEKSGTFTNKDGRIQRFKRAIDSPGEAREDFRILLDVIEIAGGPVMYDAVGDVMREMIEKESSFSKADFNDLYPELVEEEIAAD